MGSELNNDELVDLEEEESHESRISQLEGDVGELADVSRKNHELLKQILEELKEMNKRTVGDGTTEKNLKEISPK